jgi:hypothetical protein
MAYLRMISSSPRVSRAENISCASSLRTAPSEQRPIIVNNYEPPRIKKKLEFVRKAYGAGDEVTATLELKRPTGEPLANRALSAAIRLDGLDLPRVAVTTNNDGNALVRFRLPATHFARRRPLHGARR